MKMRLEQVFESHEAVPIEEGFGPDEWPTRRIDDKKSRPTPTPEQKEEMDRQIVALGKLMEDWGRWWQLDGALNITLRRIAAGGNWTGLHKDVDFSVFSHDLNALKSHVEERGCALFYYWKDDETGERKIKEILDNEVKPKFDPRLRVFAVDRQAHKTRWQLYLEARKTKDAALIAERRTDLFAAGPIVHYRGKNGQFIAWRGLVYPEKWLKGDIINFKGVEIPLSHPARFVFCKLFFDGVYHREDLEEFVVKMRTVSDEDIRDIKGTFQQYFDKLREQRRMLDDIAKRIVSRIQPTMDSSQIQNIVKEAVPTEYWTRTYGPIAEEDPEGIDQELKETARRVSRLSPLQLTYENILTKLVEFSGLKKSEDNAERALTQFESLLNHL